ncbi:hypothetical protein GCM10023144_15260 [Pigmentiphaga soli]|uniref:Peptidase M24 domain-containing protein n=1 Tax=Pigmentiphaga soli TaxID=1007095 RepID=A0ABP8GRP3_9BURK
MDRIDSALLRQRVAAVEADLVAASISALAVYAPGSALGNQAGAHAWLRFLCDFDGVNTPSLLVLRPGRPPSLLTGRKFHMRPRTAESRLWFDDVRHVAPRDFGRHAAPLLREAGRRIAWLGYDETPAPVWQAVALPDIDWVFDFDRRIARHRVRKGAAELAFHRAAAAACDAVFDALARAVPAGLPGYRLQAAMAHAARDAGCDYCDTWLTVAPAADFFRYNLDEGLRGPRPGDQLLAGVMLTVDGHWGHAVRTGTVGGPTPAQSRLYGICRDMFDAALDALRPGEDLCRVDDAMDTVLHRHYAEGEVRRTRSGHGLGYAYEDPVASQAFPNAWEKDGRPREPVEALPGMLLELHPHLFVPDVGGAMIGDMVLVTETGWELLTRHPRDPLVW